MHFLSVKRYRDFSGAMDVPLRSEKRYGGASLMRPGEERPIYETRRVLVGYERCCACGCGVVFRVPAEGVGGAARRQHATPACRVRAVRKRRQERQ